MRSLWRSLATVALLIAGSSTPSSAAPVARDAASPPAPARAEAAPERAPQIRLVRRAAVPSPDGRQTVRFDVFQRMAPLLAVNEPDGPAVEAVVSATDVIEYSFSVDQAAWEPLGSVTVSQLAGDAPAGTASALAPAGSEADVQAGERLELTLAPVHPNPVRGGLVADIVLPSADPARLELMDVMGRRVMVRELGMLGAGRHHVDLTADRGLSPGVYLLRLTQGASSRVTRVAVVE